MMYAKAFKWVLEDRPYVGCEFRLSLSKAGKIVGAAVGRVKCWS